MPAPRAALAALAALSALSAIVGSADVSSSLDYMTILQKGVSWAELNESVGPLYIPANQCSGVLDGLLECQNGAKPKAARVVVEDAGLAEVSLEMQRWQASVQRSTCDEEAVINLRLACPLL